MSLPSQRLSLANGIFIDSTIVGILWGVGHTLTILLVGGAIILFGLVIPPRLGLAMEFSVGLMLVLLGIFNLAAFWKSLGRDRFRSKRRRDGAFPLSLPCRSRVLPTANPVICSEQIPKENNPLRRLLDRFSWPAGRISHTSSHRGGNRAWSGWVCRRRFVDSCHDRKSAVGYGLSRGLWDWHRRRHGANYNRHRNSFRIRIATICANEPVFGRIVRPS